MFKLFLTSIFAVFCGFSAYAQDEIVYQDFQTIYTETPVQSYYAYPDGIQKTFDNTLYHSAEKKAFRKGYGENLFLQKMVFPINIPL